MRLKSFSFLISLLIITFSTTLLSEEKIDIWQNKKKEASEELSKPENKEIEKKSKLSTQPLKSVEKIQIQEGSSIQLNEQKVYGIYEPANYDLNLNMWSSTKAGDIKASLKRIQKIKLSTFIKR